MTANPARIRDRLDAVRCKLAAVGLAIPDDDDNDPMTADEAGGLRFIIAEAMQELDAIGDASKRRSRRDHARNRVVACPGALPETVAHLPETFRNLTRAKLSHLIAPASAGTFFWPL